MDSLFKSYMEAYHPQTVEEYRNALKEIVQEITLYGLSRSDFFKEAAFYGGTSLRIFHGLDRFSEDMDFSLQAPDREFSLDKYCPLIREALASHGLDMEVSRKRKTKVSDVQSAFIKGGTLVQLITIFNKDEENFRVISSGEKVKIKVEIDTNPPEGASFEYKYGLRPVPYMVSIYDKPSLFAGKIHAVLCRNWQKRVKGRDLYDFVWYIAGRTKVNMFHLQKRLEQSGRWESKENLTLPALKALLAARFAEIDYEEAKQDVRSFIANPQKLDIWSEDFFRSLVGGMENL